MRNQSSYQTIYICIALFLLVISFIYLRGLQQRTTEMSFVVPEQVATDTQGIHQELSVLFPEAQAIYVYDVAERRAVYEKNSHAFFPFASLTKLMTAAVALDVLDEEAVVPITNEAIKQPGDQDLIVGDRWKVKDLIILMLVSSSNDAAHALAQRAGEEIYTDIPDTDSVERFVRYMNTYANEIGLSDTVFTNPTGLDKGPEMVSYGAYGTAEDVTQLLLHAVEMYPHILTYTGKSDVSLFSLSGNQVRAENTNITLKALPGMIASKTGYTDVAGGTLTILFNRGLYDPYIITILNSSFDGRFHDIELLLDAIMR